MKQEIINTDNISLKQWLALLGKPPVGKSFVDYSFPNKKAFQEYIENIHGYSEKDVISLVRRFLIPSGSLGTDKLHLSHFLQYLKKDLLKSGTIPNLEYFRRLCLYASKRSSFPPWEGITWPLDLLPHWPKQSIEAISSYFLAHAQILPDGRLIGLSHAMALIRAKFISDPKTIGDFIEFLLELDSRQFEILVKKLYSEMGFITEITQRTRDGGRDIKANREDIGNSQKILIECKKYSKPVGVQVCRGLLGVVADEKVNKGVVVTTSNFTKDAKNLALRNPHLELIDGKSLVTMLNENLGPHWPVKIDIVIGDEIISDQFKSIRKN